MISVRDVRSCMISVPWSVVAVELQLGFTAHALKSVYYLDGSKVG
jgi:hypothetical protein